MARCVVTGWILRIGREIRIPVFNGIGLIERGVCMGAIQVEVVGILSLGQAVV